VTVRAASSYANPCTFTGREWDSALQLYYYRARFYAPQLGRFVSRDPIGYTSGLHYYAYVGDGPIRSVDPLGLNPQEGSITAPPESDNSGISPGPGSGLGGWPPAPSKSAPGKCELWLCQSNVLGGAATHSFTLIYVPGEGWVVFRGGPTNDEKPWGDLQCSTARYGPGAPDYPGIGNPTKITCNPHFVSCNSPDHLRRCFDEVCDRINRGKIPYLPVPLPVPGKTGGNCHTTTSWLYGVCLGGPLPTLPNPLKLPLPRLPKLPVIFPPKPFVPSPGLIMCPVPGCILDGFPRDLLPE
jgi:RHS repeat-associated protein